MNYELVLNCKRNLSLSCYSLNMKKVYPARNCWNSTWNASLSSRTQLLTKSIGAHRSTHLLNHSLFHILLCCFYRYNSFSLSSIIPLDLLCHKNDFNLVSSCFAYDIWIVLKLLNRCFLQILSCLFRRHFNFIQFTFSKITFWPNW